MTNTFYPEIPDSYPLTPGEWDIQFRNEDTTATCILRYRIKKEIKLGSLKRDGMKILKVVRMR